MTDVSLETYLDLGSNSIVRLHSLLIASRLNRIRPDDRDDDDDDDVKLRPLIRSSLLMALSSLPLRDVVSFNVNPFKPSAVKWLHFKEFSAVLV